MRVKPLIYSGLGSYATSGWSHRKLFKPWRKSEPNSTSELREQDFGATAAKEKHMTIRTQLTVAMYDVCNRFSPIVCNFLDDRWLIVMALMEAPDLNDDELAAKVGLSQNQVKKIFREVGVGSGG